VGKGTVFRVRLPVREKRARLLESGRPASPQLEVAARN
jgi:hypothetical protein